MLAWQFILKTRIFIKFPSIPFIFICRRVNWGSECPCSAWLQDKGSQPEITVRQREEERTSWVQRRRRNNFPLTTSLTLHFVAPWISWNHEATSARCLPERAGDTGSGLQGKVAGIYLKMPWNNTANIHILDLTNQASGFVVNRFGG